MKRGEEGSQIKRRDELSHVVQKNEEIRLIPVYSEGGNPDSASAKSVRTQTNVLANDR